MRRLATTIAALVGAFVIAGVANASITGSAHDFGGQAWSGNQICQPCHIPHNATVKDSNGDELAAPLWNHELSQATYTIFDSSTGNNANVELDQNSKLCMSCHDGTVALDSFGGATGTQFITNSKAIIGTDLSNDHPIGSEAIWQTPNPSYMVDPALRSTAGIMPLRPMADGQLAVGCTSCHEPHNRKGTDHMLWVNNSGPGTTVDGRAVDGSLLCLNCHKK